MAHFISQTTNACHMLSTWRNKISTDYTNLPKKWQKIMQKMDEEHPEIHPNRFQNIYPGANTWWYDINNETNPIDSLDDKLDGNEPTEEDDEREEIERRKRIRLGQRMLKLCKGIKRRIIIKKYFEGKSLADIGRELNMSRQLVYYHHKKALQRLRQSFRRECEKAKHKTNEQKS